MSLNQNYLLNEGENIGQQQPKTNRKSLLIGILAAVVVIIVVVIIVVVIIVVVVVTSKKGDDDTNPPQEEMTAEVHTVNFTLPEGYTFDKQCHYLPTGRVIINYKKNDSNDTYLGVMNDDGTDLTEVWHGNPTFYRSNGVRLMPFTDNQRILLGDSILECYPSLDNCNESNLLQIEYPEVVVNNSFLVWSEVVVSQDNNHITWSALGTYGAAIFIATLNRTDSLYKLNNVRLLSGSDFFEQDGDKLIPIPIRGGEMKQFANGGTAVTVAGSTHTGIAKSVYIDLTSDYVTALSHEPGYDETTIMSPDMKLGITMSTRFSPKTNFAILGLVPAPYDVAVTSELNQYTYTFAVTNVRSGLHKGNVGPVISNIERSIQDPTYHGIDLHDPSGNWVYCSPMSWHYSNLKVMWPETCNNGEQNGQYRIRIAEIKGYTPSENVETKPTPENITWSQDVDAFLNTSTKFVGRIDGKSGYLDINKNYRIYSTITYYNYSDDNQIYYNGEMVFEPIKIVANVTATNANGEVEGKMDFRLEFDSNSNLLYDLAEDGKPKTFGTATYKGTTINASIYKDDE